MRTIKLQIPDTSDLEEMEVFMAAASKLLEKGRISSGQAAEMVGISKKPFLKCFRFMAFQYSILMKLN